MIRLTLCILLAQTILVAASLTTSTTTITRTVAFGTSTRTTYIPTNTANSPPPAPMPGRPYSKVVFQSAVLNSTNFFRSRYLAKPLQWDETLARFAHRHAEGCIWEHSGGPYGENLADGFPTPTLGIDAWAAEEKHYVYPNGGFSESTGHFTQLVWQNTTRVGCAAVNCGGQRGGDAAFAWYLVCEYDPPGNVVGEFRWNVRKPGESRGGELGFGVMRSGARRRWKMEWGIVVVLGAGSLLAVAWL